MQFQIECQEVRPIPTAVIRDQVRPRDLARFVPAACGEVWSFARAAGLPKPGRNVALYLGTDGTVEAGAEVTVPFEGNGRVLRSELPAGRVATTTLFGPYSRLGEAHAAVREWCAEHGHSLSGVCWEIYGHWDEAWNADPTKIRTDVFHLIVD